MSIYNKLMETENQLNKGGKILEVQAFLIDAKTIIKFDAFRFYFWILFLGPLCGILIAALNQGKKYLLNYERISNTKKVPVSKKEELLEHTV